MSKVEAQLLDYNKYDSRLNKFIGFVYVKDIKFTLKKYNLESKGKKDILIERLTNFYKNIYRYEKYVEYITKIQSVFKGYLVRNNMKLKGPGFLNKKLCNNEEDFYTFENKNEIDNKYFFSYRDNDGFIYFYDVRSLNKLLQSSKVNPYNMKKIPEDAINILNKRIKYMENKKIDIYHEKPKLNPEQEYNNKVLTIFQKIDLLNAFAGGTQVEWFHNLSFSQLKHLYKVLEDIWNYRSEINEKQKRDIVPLNNVFKYSMSKIMNLDYKFKRKLQNVILDEIDMLISSSPSKIHRSTGCYYVLIALVEVSPDCANQMPWLIQAN